MYVILWVKLYVNEKNTSTYQLWIKNISWKLTLNLEINVKLVLVRDLPLGICNIIDILGNFKNSEITS